MMVVMTMMVMVVIVVMVTWMSVGMMWLCDAGGHDEIQAELTYVIFQLIVRCGESSTQAKVGECLGELGAVDPGWYVHGVWSL